MNKVNCVKNIAIIADFIVSIVASALQNSKPSLSGILFGASAVILFVAVVCVVIEWIKGCKK